MKTNNSNHISPTDNANNTDDSNEKGSGFLTYLMLFIGFVVFLVVVSKLLMKLMS